MITLARSVAERATRHLVFSRRLPSEFKGARLLVSSAGGLKYLVKPMSSIDAGLLRNARELVRLDDVVWDVGANLGLFSFAAASIAGPGGKVFAFEPDTWLVQLLRRSARMQEATCSIVTVLPIGVASGVGLRQFHIARRARASNFLSEYGQGQTGGTAEVQIVPTFNLDRLLDTVAPPTLIKCDVEGAELEVFRDQHRILHRIRPIVLCEVAAQVAGEMTRIFHAHDYLLFNGERTLWNAQQINLATWNTIAIPAERCRDFLKRR